MVSYSYKDVKIQIRGEELYCSDMSVSYSAELTSTYNLKSESSFEYLPAKSPVGTVDFSYYLTGADPLVSHVTNHKEPVAFNLGGYAFQSGFLNKYSLNLSPNSYAKVSAGLSFFERISSNFSPSSSTLKERDILRVGDIRLSNNAYILEDEILSLSYGYGVAVNPIYIIDYDPDHQEKQPHRIQFGQKKVNSAVSVYKQDLDLPVTGFQEQFKIKLNDKDGNEKQSYVINGRLTSKTAKVSAGGRLTNEINIRQANLGVVDADKMTITDIWPFGGDEDWEPEAPTYAMSGNRYYPGLGAISSVYPDRVGITGTNFIDIEKIWLGDYQMEISGDYSEIAITGIVPKGVPSNYQAPIRVYGRGDFAMSADSFFVVSGATL